MPINACLFHDGGIGRNPGERMLHMREDGLELARKGMLSDPGDHFRDRFEMERKFRVDDLDAMAWHLGRCGAVPFVLGNCETDIFLDLPDGRLEANNQFHTLRQMLPSGRVLWISKGPAKDECVAMDLADFDKALAMLTSLGFVETRRIGKKRDIYFVDEFHVTLDDVAGIGTFVELAIMTDDEDALLRLRDKIQQAADKLGLLDFVEEKASYRQMLFG